MKEPVPRFVRDEHRVEWVKLKFLHRDRTVQRPFDPKHRDRIAQEFDPDKFNALHATLDRDGVNYSVFAHQHSMEAARLVLGDEQMVPVIVHTDLNVQRKAEIWLGLDEGKRPKVLDKWKIRILAKEPDPIKIQRILESYDLQIDDRVEEGVVRAVGAVEGVFRDRGEVGLRWVLDVITKSWGLDQDGYQQSVVAGLGVLHRLLAAEQKSLEPTALSTKLSVNSGPAKLLGQARDYAKSATCSVPRAVATKIVNIYNKGRQNGRLDLKV